METEQVKSMKYGPIVAVVNSASEPDKKYEVRQRADSTYSCNCMGWRFNKDTPRQCRHTKAAAGGGPLPKALPSSRTPQQITGVSTEAQAAAKFVLQGYSASQKELTRAAERIEQAIKKFMGQLATAGSAAIEEVAPGVRMITLED